MEDLGKVAYDAYSKFSGGKSLISGAPLPSFYVLDPTIQHAWSAAAQAVAENIAGALK